MAQWLGALGAMAAVIGLVTAILDMASNGGQYARWAPWGLGIALVGLAAAGYAHSEKPCIGYEHQGEFSIPVCHR